ncbi:MAG: flagellar basal body-associated FliL family protein [Alphaproteobacteria bacterium]
MSDDDITESSVDDDGGGKGGKGKLIIIVLAALLVLGGGGGAAAYFMGMFDPPPAEGEQAELDAVETEEDIEEAAKSAVFMELQDMTVTLNSRGRTRFLKLSVALELTAEEDKAKVEAVLPRVVDQFQIYLRELRVEDLRGSAGVYRLREELLYRVSKAVPGVDIRNVLFQSFIIQ